MNQNEPLTLVVAADRNYAMPLAVTLSSLLRHLSHPENLQLHVLDGGLTQKQRAKVFAPLCLEKSQITFHPLKQNTLPHPKNHPHLTVATSYRFLIPELLPADCQRALYIDSDVLITGDLKELWNQDISVHACGGVIDTYAPRADADYGIHNYKQLGIPPETKCLNAGVLLINIKLWKEQKVTERALAYLSQYKDEMKLVSQQALNATLNGDWYELDPRWNQLINPLPFYDADPPSVPTLDALEPGILHFITTCKPWHFHYRHPYGQQYLKELSHTSWSSWQPQGPSFLSKVTQKLKRLLS